MSKEKRGTIMLFTGDEDFLLKEKIKSWKKASEEKYGEFNVMSISLEIPNKDAIGYISLRSKEIASEFLTPSFFGEKRVIFLENFPVSDKKGLTKDADKFFMKIYKSLENLPENNVVIMSSFKPDKRTSIYKNIKKIAQVEEFKKLESQELYDWILNKTKSLEAKMLANAARFLAEYCGNDLWKIDQEIKKLVSYCEKETISEEHIQEICLPHTELADFALSNALQNSDTKKAIKILKEELDLSTHPQVIISRDLATVIRQILNVKWASENNKSAKEISMHPFVFSKWKNSAFKFSYSKIKEAFNLLLAIDEGLKTGKIDTSSNNYSMFSLEAEKFIMKIF